MVLKVEREGPEGDFIEVLAYDDGGELQLFGVGEYKTPTLGLGKKYVTALNIATVQDSGMLRIRVQEDEVAPGDEILAYWDVDDFKLMICGQAAQLVGTDGASVTGCRLRLVAR